jgi:hypothetical protein
MIVSAARDDLRDEFTMADEAFALSPISARASLPSEEDYEAIREAFMETSRGRWFLGEYARRNRNADTRMVLDAVARIEESLAAQRQPAPRKRARGGAGRDQGALEEAKAAASAALDSLALEENLAPSARAARVIREIAWRLREIGADGRICDLIDSQVGVVQAGCGQISSAGPRAALIAAFDLIEERIKAFGGSDTATPQGAAAAADEAKAPPLPAEDNEVATSMPAEAAIVTPEVLAVRAEVADVPVETADVPAAALDVTPEAGDENPEAADPYDDALLDMVALEMAAPDPSDTDAAFDTVTAEIQVGQPPPADPESVAERPEPMVAPALPSAIQPPPQPSPEVSLGSTLIANGIVRRPHPAASDPLARSGA